MEEQLTHNNKADSAGGYLTEDKNLSVPFRISIETELKNGYQFKDMKPSHLKKFSRFIQKTVNRNLTISQVEKLFLRTKGGASHPEIFNGATRDMLHFSNGNRDCRIFGYYNEHDYFVLCRIDPEHQYKIKESKKLKNNHKSKN